VVGISLVNIVHLHIMILAIIRLADLFCSFYHQLNALLSLLSAFHHSYLYFGALVADPLIHVMLFVFIVVKFVLKGSVHSVLCDLFHKFCALFAKPFLFV
jgi:hypothetical protein